MDEEKIQNYVKRGYSNRLILLSVASQKSPKTILVYARELKKLLN